MNGEELTRWTIRVALAAWAGRLALASSRSPGSSARAAIARGLWTIGCAFLWIHVACAFHVHHHWSHAAAWAHTASRTAAVTGHAWGFGIWINYLVMGLWGADVLWWWISPRKFRERSRLVEWVWQGVLAFVVFNATVVFESGPIRWAGIATTIVLLGLLVRTVVPPH